MCWRMSEKMHEIRPRAEINKPYEASVEHFLLEVHI